MSGQSRGVILRDKASLRVWRASLPKDPGQPLLAFVPTMGFLHEGHLALIREARLHASSVIVSIFVNPTQFNNPEDFDSYPRDEEGDCEAAFRAGADAVFLPTPEIVYPSGAQTRVNVGSLAHSLCGATRPGHFEGVCTVVTALFNLTGCDIAIFGEKDYQQLTIIKRMSRDLHLPLKIIGMPTQRDHDGVALSSRNARLTPEHRQEASSIHRALSQARIAWYSGERDIEQLKSHVLMKLSTHAQLDYLEICDHESLEVLSGQDHQRVRAVIAIACFFGDVRLIDNLMLGDSPTHETI